MVSGKCKVQNVISTVLPEEGGEREAEQRICYHIPICAQTLWKDIRNWEHCCLHAEELSVWDRKDPALHTLLYLWISVPYGEDILGCWKTHNVFCLFFFAKMCHDFNDNPIVRQCKIQGQVRWIQKVVAVNGILLLNSASSKFIGFVFVTSNMCHNLCSQNNLTKAVSGTEWTLW